MNEKYRGDSYDLVKRFFSEVLSPIGRLYAHPKFVPLGIHGLFTNVTTIPILPESPREDRFGILLDPDTGIRLPTDPSDHVTISHVSLKFITAINQDLHPDYMICFDQSYHRKGRLSRRDQMRKKVEFLHAGGMASFYYASHAPFLFTAERAETLQRVRDRLMSAGIPKCKFDPCEF